MTSPILSDICFSRLSFRANTSSKRAAWGQLRFLFAT
jgi:hypothetical protein